MQQADLQIRVLQVNFRTKTTIHLLFQNKRDMREIYNGSHMSPAIRTQEPSIYHVAQGMEHFGFCTK